MTVGRKLRDQRASCGVLGLEWGCLQQGMGETGLGLGAGAAADQDGTIDEVASEPSLAGMERNGRGPGAPEPWGHTREMQELV